MKKLRWIGILLLFVLMLSYSPLKAMPLAEIRSDGYYLTYNAQTGGEDIQFLNINGDLGLNNNLGLRFGYFYTGEGQADFLDLLFKFKAFEEQNFSLAGIFGLHGNTVSGYEGTSVGLAYLLNFRENIDFIGSFQSPWGGGGNLGYSLGLAFHVTPRSSLQLGFRNLVGRPNSFGLVLGLMTEI